MTKYLWIGVNTIALIIALTIWFGYESATLRYLCLGLNAISFVLALPATVTIIPVAFAANYYLDVNALSVGGIYFNTFLLLGLGGVQHFLIANLSKPVEATMQRIGI
ncbi:MAG TPA: hypothetical protein PKM58_07145 [Pyrinomonadaceae bacterium]|nr:hypothetical protein [Pyrinomonadaceae bacterium]HNU06753.1 hypothetical protein [Pyrinomonadaceae bacterium]